MIERADYKEIIYKSLNTTERPVYVPLAFGERKDTKMNLSNAYQEMQKEPSMMEPSTIPLENGDSLIFLSLPAAASHTLVSLQAEEKDAGKIEYLSTPMDGFSIPAQQFHWIYRQNADGEAEPLTHNQLAAYPYTIRQQVLKEHSERILAGKNDMDQALIDQNIPNAERGSYIYATIGHHPIEKRLEDGFSRGPQSNPTIHTAVTFFQDPETVTQTKKIVDLSPQELLKDIDPLSGLFFDKTKDSIKSLLEHIIIYDHHIQATIDVIPESDEQKEVFPYGWKVTFNENTSLENGLEMATLFISQMKGLWESAKIVRQIPDDEKAKQQKEMEKQKMIQTIGLDGYTQFTSFTRTSGERESSEIQALHEDIENLEERLQNLKPNTKKYKKLEMRKHLLEDINAEPSRFTMPGEPSFNIVFDVDAEDNRLHSFFLTPALSEKGVAEKITGAILQRAERN